MRMELECPDELLQRLQWNNEELGLEVRLMLAARLYEKGLASTGRAAELAGVPRVLLLERLADFGVPLSDLTEEELRQDLEHARHGSQ